MDVVGAVGCSPHRGTSTHKHTGTQCSEQLPLNLRAKLHRMPKQQTTDSCAHTWHFDPLIKGTIYFHYFTTRVSTCFAIIWFVAGRKLSSPDSVRMEVTCCSRPLSRSAVTFSHRHSLQIALKRTHLKDQLPVVRGRFYHVLLLKIFIFPPQVNNIKYICLSQP